MQLVNVTKLTDVNAPYRVLVIGYGGTIQMELVISGGKSFNAPPEDTVKFEAILKAKLADVHGLEFDFLLMSTEDSIDKGPKDWMLLAEQVWEAQRAGYDAVIVIHGTDTMAYSAQALWLAFFDQKEEASALRMPVIVTGAQNSVYVAGGDGIINLQNAARTALAAIEQGVADVLVVMWDTILRGIHVQKISEKDFRAPIRNFLIV